MLWPRMFERKRVSLKQIGLDWAEGMSFYRVLNNPRVGLAEVIENQLQRHSLPEVGGHGLAMSDTTSINLARHRQRLRAEGLGYIGGGAGQKMGFYTTNGHQLSGFTAKGQGGKGAKNIRQSKLLAPLPPCPFAVKPLLK